MRMYLNRKSIFAAMFMIMLFGFAIINAFREFPVLADTFKEFKNIKGVGDIKKQIARVDSNIDKEQIWKIQFIEGYGYLQLLMGKNEFNNFSYVKNDQGFLDYASLYREEDPLMEEYAKRVRRLKENVESSGTRVMFISPPSKYIPRLSRFSEKLEVNDHNPLQDEFLYNLFKNGIDYLDLRQPLLKSGLPYDNIFYKTDHHWTSQAAFVSFCALAERIKELYGLDLDPDGFYCDINNYYLKTYKENMLGSQGRSTGVNYSGLEDFTLIWPKFDTNFKYESKNRNAEGSFEEALLKLEALDHASDIYGPSSYTTYIDDVKAWDKIVNLKNPEGPKILMIRDSFSNPMVTFLASLCSEIHMIWTLAPEEKTNVEQYLKENEFDYIFIELYPGNINADGISFFKK